MQYLEPCDFCGKIYSMLFMFGKYLLQRSVTKINVA